MENIFTKKIPSEEKDKKKEFRPGEHLIFKRIVTKTNHYGYKKEEFSLGGKLSIPEGYQILTSHASSLRSWDRASGSFDIVGIDIWLINTKRVRVTPVYNQRTEEYDFSEPGVVVETLIEEPEPPLRLKF